MEFAGIKIGGAPKEEAVVTAVASPAPVEVKPVDGVSMPKDTDHSISGYTDDHGMLKKVKGMKEFEEDSVIYGVYNNADKSWTVRLNDFLIDHSSVSVKDKSYFFHMLAVMVDAGIPVVQALKSLAKRTKNKKFARVLNTLGYSCEKGGQLSEGMSRFEDVFDETEIGIVESGEATGRLNKMLFKLSGQLDSRHELIMKLWGAAVYPIAVFSVLILVAIGMLVWIFPTLLGLLQEGGVSESTLPLATRVLIWLQTAVVGYWWLIILGGAVIYGIFVMYVGSSYGALRWDYLKLRLPLVGVLSRKVHVLRFISLLGILMEAGLPVIKALRITGEAIPNRVYRLKIQEVINDVKSGGKISASLQDSEYLFPGEVTQMLSVGEESASLGPVSEKVADQYQREIENTLKKLTSVFEPVMVLIVGISVALLALAVMAPIFNLSNTIGI